MNSLYDPDFTGSGNQPEYFDQLAALYNRYRVYGSAIKVTCIPFTAGTQNNVPVNVVLVPSAQSLASYGIEDAAGLPRAQNRVSTGNMDYKNQTMVASHSVSEILGVKDVEGADRLQALVSSSPAEECLWSVVARSADNTTAASLAISVRITYDCEFFDRQVAVQSLLQEKKEKMHLQSIKQELKDIEAYQKLHKTFEPVELKDNQLVHEKWLKLREADDLARETPKSRPPSKK
jgi:hypothetical protein